MKNTDDIKKQMAQRKLETEKALRDKKQSDRSNFGNGIDDDFVIKCLNNNEQGDGALFKKLYRKNFVFNKSMDGWLAWTGHHWDTDKMGHAQASVVGVSDVYRDAGKKRLHQKKKLGELAAAGAEVDLTEIKKITKEANSLLKRAEYLRTNRRRRNCLHWTHTQKDPLAIDGVEIDQKPLKLACPNGVISLDAGDLTPGRQKDWLMKASPVEYPKKGIESDYSDWENTLLEIFSGSQKLVDFFRRLIGYALIGEVRESIFVVMTGRGRNGKSLIVEILSSVFGPLAGAIRSEMLLDQNRVANSAGPSPDVMFLRGLRFAFASETDAGQKFSPSKIKWFTGGDTLTGRNPHDKFPTQFQPTHTLFLLTNNDPRAPAEDFAFWERVIRIPFEISFVDREPKNENERRADPNLGKKLKKQLPQILAWAVKGCLEYQRIGLNPPAIVKNSVEEYHQDMDSLGEFIEECCLIGDEYQVKASEIYFVFEGWWKQNISNRVPKMRWFGKRFAKRFDRKKSGVYWYLGVKIALHLGDN